MPTANYYNNLSQNQIFALSDSEKKSFFDTVFSWSFTASSGKTYISNSPANDTVTAGQGISHDSLDALFNNGLDTTATQITIGVDDARSIILGNTQYVLLTKQELTAPDLGLSRSNSWWVADSNTQQNHYTIDQPGVLNNISTGADTVPLYALLQVINLPAPTYLLSSTAETVIEGGSVTFSLNTTNVAEGTNIPYTISGVSLNDIYGNLNGSIVIDSNGRGTIEIDIRNDSFMEANETLTLSLNGVSDSVNIIDGVPGQNTPTWVEFNFEDSSQFAGHTYVDGWTTDSQAIQFTGNNDWIKLDIDDQPVGSDGYTLQFLYQFNTAAGFESYNVLAASTSGGEFVYTGGNLGDNFTNPFNITVAPAETANYVNSDWHVITSQMKPINGTESFQKSTWIDGNFLGSITVPADVAANVNFSSIVLGSPSTNVQGANDNDFRGLIDDLRITFDPVSYADIANYGMFTTPDIEPSDLFVISQTDSIEEIELLTAGTGPLNTLALPDDAGDVYFEFGEDGTGLLIPNDPTKWPELADVGSVTIKAGFNGIAAGAGDDTLLGSDANSEVFAPGSFNEFGNIVYGGDDDNNATVDYVDYRSESEFTTQTVEATTTVDVLTVGGAYETQVITEERQFNGVVLALKDNTGEDGYATVQRSLSAFDEISSIEGVLGSTKNDALDASQIGASGAVLAGFEGDDLLIGSDAKDVLVGGSGNDTLVAGNELSGVNLLEGGLGKDTIVASGAKDLFFVRLGDDLSYPTSSGSGYTNSGSGYSTTKEQVVDFQLSGDSAKFVGRDNLVKDEFLFVSDNTSVVTADFNNNTKVLTISSVSASYSGSYSGAYSSSYSVAVDIKTESGTPTTSYYDAITQRTVDYTVSAFVVQGQPIINNTPDLSGVLLAGSAYSSVLAATAESVTRVGLLRQRMGELIDTAGVADAVVGGREDDIIVLSGKGSEIKGDLAIGGQGSDLYEVRMVSDLRSAADTTAIEHDNITIREMGARGGSNNHDGIFIEGVKDIWSDITLARSSDGKSLEIDYKQYTHNDLTGTYIQQSQGELNVYKQYDYKAPYYRVEKLALQDADDGTTTIFNLGMNAKAGTADSIAGFKEKISAVEFDTSVSTDLEFDGENHWLVGSGKDIYNLSGIENDAVVMLTGYDSADKLQLSNDFVYEYFDYEADGDLEALFVQAGIGGDNVLDTGRDGVLVVAQQDSTTGSPIDHWMILM
ncbi:MAG: hypothetical protein K9J78_09280, partial [Polynucleobacter sp.]|nr:hypothetical protein [Polynucleobacter sp.]